MNVTHHPLIQNRIATHHESVAQALATILIKRIIDNQLEAGERIKEASLCNEFSASRGSVREALLIVNAKQLIDIHPNKGAQVRELTAQQVRSVFDAASANFCFVSAKAVMLWRSDELPVLNQLCDKALAAYDEANVAGFFNSALAIYYYFGALVNNPYLSSTVEQVMPTIQRCINIVLKTLPTLSGKYQAHMLGLKDSINSRNSQMAHAHTQAMLLIGCEQVIQAQSRIKQIELALQKRGKL